MRELVWTSRLPATVASVLGNMGTTAESLSPTPLRSASEAAPRDRGGNTWFAQVANRIELPCAIAARSGLWVAYESVGPVGATTTHPKQKATRRATTCDGGMNNSAASLGGNTGLVSDERRLRYNRGEPSS